MKRNAWVGCCLAIALNVQAKPDPASQLKDLLNDLQHTQGQFSQNLYNQRGQVIQSSSGTFALSRPGKFRWQTLTPAPQLLVADGAKVWLYDPGLNQASWFKQESDNKQSPAMLLVGDINGLTKQYRITVKDSSDQTVFHLQPKRDSFFSQVNLVFSDDSLSDMVIKDNLGQVTKIHFSDMQEGSQASQFRFSPPKGADIVEAAI